MKKKPAAKKFTSKRRILNPHKKTTRKTYPRKRKTEAKATSTPSTPYVQQEPSQAPEVQTNFSKPVVEESSLRSQPQPPAAQNTTQPETDSQAAKVETSPLSAETTTVESSEPLTHENNQSNLRSSLEEPHPIAPAPPSENTQPLLVNPSPSPATQTDDDISDDFPSSSKKPYIIGLILLLIVAGLSAVGYYLFFFRHHPAKMAVATLPTPIKPPPTLAKKNLVRSNWYLEVLNGSGVTGAAAKSAKSLSDEGYHVIKIASADRSDYATTQLFVVKSKMNDADLLLKDLQSLFTISSISGELKVTDSSTASARIILGKNQ